jgi:hypothetical protein
MKRIRGTSATTHPDRHGDQLTVGALVKNAEDANKAYYPLGLNHDPRIPPIGRIIRSAVVPREQGHAALEVVAEQFEEGDTFDLGSTPKRLAPYLFRTEPEIIRDANFDDPQSIRAITELASALGLRTRKHTKKALAPLSVLIVTATSWIAAGFLKGMGSDLYMLAKKSLTALMKRRGGRTQVLVFQFETAYEGRTVQVEVCSTNPTKADVERFLDMNECEVNARLKSLFSQHEVVRVVGEFSDGVLVPKFALRADGVPFDSSGHLIAHRGELPEGLSISFQEKDEVSDPVPTRCPNVPTGADVAREAIGQSEKKL